MQLLPLKRYIRFIYYMRRQLRKRVILHVLTKCIKGCVESFRQSFLTVGTLISERFPIDLFTFRINKLMNHVQKSGSAIIKVELNSVLISCVCYIPRIGIKLYVITRLIVQKLSKEIIGIISIVSKFQNPEI